MQAKVVDFLKTILSRESMYLGFGDSLGQTLFSSKGCCLHSKEVLLR